MNKEAIQEMIECQGVYEIQYQKMRRLKLAIFRTSGILQYMVTLILFVSVKKLVKN